MEPAAATIGNFDGLHLGHKALIETLCKEASGLKKIVLSFYPHPQVVLGRVSSIPQITPLRQKADIFSEWGIDELHLFHFTKKVSSIDYRAFLGEIVLKGLHVKTLIVGPDARLGTGGEGTVDKIRLEYERVGQKVIVANVLSEDSGEKISSRKIRGAIIEGNITLANALLGRSFALSGRVVKGDGRGRTIGVPTLNTISRGQVLPKKGVYATATLFPGEKKTRPSVTNIGSRPTFNGEGITVETHLLEDISGRDLVKKLIQVEFIKRLRDEIKFESKENLVFQIKKDIEAAKLLFAAK